MEAVIVTGVLAIIMACMWAAVSYQKVKLEVMAEARAQAWQAALQPCEGSGDTLNDIAGETGSADSDSMPGTQSVDKYLDVGTTSLATDSGYVDVTRKRSVTFPKMIGGATYQMQGSMYMRCNEPNPPENVTDFFKTAFSVVKYSFSF